MLNDTYSTRIDTLNFAGGIPIPSDFAPSLFFATFYVVFFTPILIYRYLDPQTRDRILTRPTSFYLTRIVSYVLRAVLARTTSDDDTLTAEIMLLSVPFLLLSSTTVSLWQRHWQPHTPHEPAWLNRLAVLLQLTLAAAMATGLAASTIGRDDAATAATLDKLRKASYILSLVVVCTTALGVVQTHRHFGTPVRGTALLLAVCALTLVVAAYHVARVYAVADAWVKTSSAFYVLAAAVEVLVLALLLGVRIPDVFPGLPRRWGEEEIGMKPRQGV